MHMDIQKENGKGGNGKGNIYTYTWALGEVVERKAKREMGKWSEEKKRNMAARNRLSIHNYKHRVNSLSLACSCDLGSRGFKVLGYRFFFF